MTAAATRQPTSPGSAERRKIRYTGRVQGVGFRYTTRSIAARLPVTGYVQNMPDGSVELVAEGQPPDLDRLVAAVGAELGRYIQHQETSVQPASGEFATFEIRM